MTNNKHDVVAIGNAIVDIIGQCDDAFLEKHECVKGSMALVDASTINKLYDDMGPAIEVSGGSAANTIAGVSSFGGTTGFIGKVSNDDFGRVFTHDLRAADVTFNTSPAAAGSQPTARSLVLVTPDGERTMNTFLGVSPELDHGEVDPELIKSAGIVYLEGYLFDRPEAKAAFRSAAEIAASAGARVALTLSDGFCVDRHRSEFLALIRDGVDVLFANEAEIISLYETSSFDDAVNLVKNDTKLAAITRGGEGSVIVSDGSITKVAVEPVDKVVDTTGAGDLFASGFLYGLSKGADMATAGRLGSVAAAEIISHLGARPREPLDKLAKTRGIII